MTQADPAAQPRAPGGVHISRGVTLRIPPGGLVISRASDQPKMEVKRVELQLDTCVHWLEIALDHLSCAKAAHAALVEAKTSGGDFAALLDREFKTSMQAAVAAATFFEALYAATLERIPTKPVPYSPGNRQSRYSRVTEQLRKSFGLRKQGTANLSSVLREVYRFRDEAVHPSATFNEPVLHPHLQVGVEKRFVMFCYESARQLVRAALGFSKILPSRNMSRQPKAMQELGAYLLQVCSPLYVAWEESYGALLDGPPSTYNGAEPGRAKSARRLALSLDGIEGITLWR